MNKNDFKPFLYDICSDCNCHSENKYCTLIEFLTEVHNSHRLLMQMKCVEKFKYEQKQDISWNDAFQLWVDSGKALIFAKLYNENIKFATLYKKIMSEG